MTNVRAFLLDDHELVRRGIRDLLEDTGIEVVGEAGSGAQAAVLATKLLGEQ